MSKREKQEDVWQFLEKHKEFIKSPYAVFVAVGFSIYFIFKFGVSVGEFLYYVTK